MTRRFPALSLTAMFLIAGIGPLRAQMPGAGGPPAVGVAAAAPKPVTETQEFVGRIQAEQRVALVARVTAFIDKQTFTEGSEVKAGDLLYVLEQGPFEADLAAKQAAVAQAQAQLDNARLVFQRASSLLKTPAGQQAAVDAARATLLSDAAQLQANEAQVQQSAINLAYTEIHAPIAGRIGRTSVTPGNVVSPGSGILTTIVSQDPMYVVFSVPTRTAIGLASEPGGDSGFRIRVRLPDGRIYAHDGTLNFVDNTVGQGTDTLTLRGVIANPVVPGGEGAAPRRPLVDGEFVGVLLEGAKPAELLAIPRPAVMTDQQGDYVYVVDKDNHVQQTRVKLGPVVGTEVAVLTGLSAGQRVIVDGLQKVHPGQVVAPGPASPMPAAAG